MPEQIRLGVIVPSVNSVVEAWYPRAVPDGVSVHFARMLMPAGTSPERIIEMDRTEGIHSMQQLASCKPHAVAYGCTASSIVQGHQFDAHTRDPLASLQFVEEDFAWATRKVMDVADKTAQGRVVSVLEGGYDLQGLSQSAAAHVIALMRG